MQPSIQQWYNSLLARGTTLSQAITRGSICLTAVWVASLSFEVLPVHILGRRGGWVCWIGRRLLAVLCLERATDMPWTMSANITCWQRER